MIKIPNSHVKEENEIMPKMRVILPGYRKLLHRVRCRAYCGEAKGDNQDKTHTYETTRGYPPS